MPKSCEACLMPFSKDPGNRMGDKYCSYCSTDGEFHFDGSREEFQKKCYQGMVDHGMNKLQAKFFAWMIRFAPHWKGEN